MALRLFTFAPCAGRPQNLSHARISEMQNHCAFCMVPFRTYSFLSRLPRSHRLFSLCFVAKRRNRGAQGVARFTNSSPCGGTAQRCLIAARYPHDNTRLSSAPFGLDRWLRCLCIWAASFDCALLTTSTLQNASLLQNPRSNVRERRGTTNADKVWAKRSIEKSPRRRRSLPPATESTLPALALAARARALRPLRARPPRAGALDECRIGALEGSAICESGLPEASHSRKRATHLAPRRARVQRRSGARVAPRPLRP